MRQVISDTLPDILVEPTIEGVRKDKDEVLEKLLK
jgi:hypothetical protein